MKKGFNIVDMGNDVNQAIAEFQQTIPEEVNIYRITDQSVVVDQSVWTFLRELLFAIVAVVIVVMLLLPMRVALVAASTIPITIFISLGLYYAFNIELNTCTLAALIVTLGMIVDNSIVIIDNNLESIGEGRSRWHASIDSTIHFFKSIFSATLAISITFFPFLIVCSGMIQDFVLSFPWTVTIVLGTSLLIATMLVPFMQYFFIRKPLKVKQLLYNEAVCPIEIHLSNDNFIGAPIVAAVMIYVILLSHFRNVKLSTLVALSMLLCLLGAALGLKIQGIDFSVTSVLGLTSLMGIIVRNGIIMIDYAEELRTAEHMSVRGAILCSAGLRRHVGHERCTRRTAIVSAGS